MDLVLKTVSPPEAMFSNCSTLRHNKTQSSILGHTKLIIAIVKLFICVRTYTYLDM
jgi:hypothetical protein